MKQWHWKRMVKGGRRTIWSAKRFEWLERLGSRQFAVQPLESRLMLAFASFFINSPSITEGDNGSADLTFNISRNGDLSQPISVGYTTANGSALAGTDYVTQKGIAVFPAGVGGAIVKVPIKGDTAHEGDETLQLRLTGVVGETPKTITFGAKGTVGFEDQVDSFVLSDLTQDTYLDMVALTRFPAGHITTLVSDGSQPYANLLQPTDIADVRALSPVAGDLNADGKPDVLAYDYENNHDVLLINHTPALGLVSFASSSTVDFGDKTDRLRLVDVNGDGKLDIVATLRGAGVHAVAVALNTTTTIGGVPTFAPTKQFETGENPVDIVAGDFNGDGKIDLATANFTTTGSITILLNTAPAGEATPSFQAQSRATTKPLALADGDFNGDGRTDLAIYENLSGSTYSVQIWNNATAPGAALTSFDTTPQPIEVGSASAGPLLAADLNNDGRFDLVAPAQTESVAKLLTNTTPPGGAVQFAGPASLDSGYPAKMELADFSHNGRPDLIVANASGVVTILRNQSFGVFEAAVGTGTIHDNDPLAPEIQVYRKSGNHYIELHDNQVAVLNFGSVKKGKAGPVISFRVTNTGAATLSITKLKLPKGFQIVDAPAASLAPGQSDTFSLKMLTTAAANRSGLVQLLNNDADEGVFRIRVKGTVHL